jgi:hypothetical protein
MLTQIVGYALSLGALYGLSVAINRFFGYRPPGIAVWKQIKAQEEGWARRIFRWIVAGLAYHAYTVVDTIVKLLPGVALLALGFVVYFVASTAARAQWDGIKNIIIWAILCLIVVILVPRVMAWMRRMGSIGAFVEARQAGMSVEEARAFCDRKYPPTAKDIAYHQKCAAKAGKAKAQATLGRMYSEGVGVKQNYIKAAKWMTKAAEQGEATAQAFLGVAYYKGRGVRQNYILAYKWLSLAIANHTEVGMRDAAMEARDLAASKMSPAQIAEATALASAI